MLVWILNDFIYETKGISISISFAKLETAYCELNYHYWNKYSIAVSDEFKNEAISSDVLTGGIVHEVCHSILAREQNIFFHFISIFSKHYRKLQEAYLDMLAINKGYFNSLVALAKYIENDLEGDSWDPDMGLTPLQLKTLKDRLSGTR